MTLTPIARASSPVAAALLALSLAACADAGKPMAPTMLVSLPPQPSAAETANAASLAQFIARERAEAHRLDAAGALADARLHWRYVAAVAPGDSEANQEIASLDVAIRQRVNQLLAQGETAFAAGRGAEAQTDFLKVLALDGANERARERLRTLDTRAELAAQDRKDKMAAQAMKKAMGTEGPGDE